MASFIIVMIVGASFGLIGLYLISGDLARRAGLTSGGRLLLAVGLGFGVIAISLKLFIVSTLLHMTDRLHPAPQSQVSSESNSSSPFEVESVFTAPWQALPSDADLTAEEKQPIEVVNLGRHLFNDSDLSSDRKIACSSCHKFEAGGADKAAVSAGISGLLGNRNAPTVWNTRYLSRLFWDGRAASLEEQAKGPLTNPVEMGMPDYAAIEQVVRAKPEYVEAFERAYGANDAVTIDNIAHAIASYERTLVSPETSYDRFVRGDVTALTPSQIRGMALFAGLGCRMCHRDPTFSAAGTIKPAGVYKPFPVFPDNEYVQKYDLLADHGLRDADGGVTAKKTGLWRVPSLRNSANTAPYFHNGRVTSLEEAIRVMAVSQLRWRVVSDRRKENPTITWDSSSRKLSFYRPGEITPDDISDIAEFLHSISFDGKDPTSGTNNSHLSKR
jgi:cytochrome c peroxidase